jgi:hypothetical protein
MRLVAAILTVAINVGMCLAEAAESDQNYKREQIIKEYVSKTRPDLVLLATKKDKIIAKEAASSVIKSTDATFSYLAATKLSNDKIQVYEAAWIPLRATLGEDPQDPATLKEMNEFRTNILLAASARSSKSTVFVTASNGNGATVRYAKAADAARLENYLLLGVTPFSPHELERGTYVFKAFRDGVETGSTGNIPCTASTTTVNIVEN